MEIFGSVKRIWKNFRPDRWLLALMLWAVCPLTQAQNDPVFSFLTVEDGLSNNWVKAILKDHDGFMWFGTFNGLNRYDGQSFQTFHPNDSSGLSDQFIESLAEDAWGRLWVGTFSGGLCRFDRLTERFAPHTHAPDDPRSIRSNRVLCILPDSAGNLWIGTDQGLDRFDPETDTFEHVDLGLPRLKVYSLHRSHHGWLWVGTDQGLFAWQGPERVQHFAPDPADPGSLAHPDAKSLYEDKYGNLWIGTWGGGLDRWQGPGQGFEHFRASQQIGTLGNDNILQVLGDGGDFLYVATEGGGLHRLDLRSRRFSQYLPDLRRERSINSNSVHALAYDAADGILWVGTYNGGINYFSQWDKPFRHIRAQVNGLNDNHITCLEEDQHGNIWIGTDGGGINIWTPETNRFRYVQAASGRIQSDAILSLYCDRANRMWVGSFQGGLDLLDATGNLIRRFRPRPDDPRSLSGSNVSAIYEDKRGQIWVGTMSAGLHRYRSDGGFDYYQHDPSDPQSLADNFIFGMFEDRLGRLLVQTGGGLELFDPRQGTFSRLGKQLETDFENPVALLEDSQGNLWLGSNELGLFRIDRTGVEVRRYAVKDGLPSNSIAGILEDEVGNLWVSTHKGLCKFEEAVTKPERVRIYTYAVEDGLQGSEFKRGAYCLRRNGEMLYGGQNGFNLFDPTDIKNNPFVPPVHITGLRLFNRKVDFADSDLLAAPIAETQAITLTHQQSVITFEFSALNYLLSDKNQYAYQMVGFEDAWNYVGTQNSATYTNLDPGTYTFRVKASNNDGIWNEAGTTLAITILPPWWETWYFRGGVLLLFILLIVGVYQIRTFQLKLSKRQLEQQVSLRTADLEQANQLSEARQVEISRQNETLRQKNHALEQQAAEIRRMALEIEALHEAKIRFFTNISHELRTPLNLILWPLEELMAEDLSPARKERLQLMHRNAQMLIKLINQLLDFRKIETGTLKLHPLQQDVMTVIRQTAEAFLDWAQRRQLDFSVHCEPPQLNMAVDADKLEKVLSNLLSNAIKFVQEGGRIELRAEQQPAQSDRGPRLRIEVIDNGPGIDTEQQAHLFERFYEGKRSRFPGSGIGLSLVKELVELHEGCIEVDSAPGRGTRFTVELPTDLPSEGQAIPAFEGGQPVSLPTGQASTPQVESANFEEERPMLLLVEDNLDILHFMQEQLQQEYVVAVAENGAIGIEKALEHMPDLIICDVMMPEVDGFELVQTLKQDLRTSHIPIVLVTARTGEEDRRLGLTFGADDYITKPFAFPLLRLKLRNMLFTRQQLKDQILAESWVDHESLSAVDAQFMRQAVQLVRDHLSDSEFGVEDFSEPFHMSRRNVLRKLKAITGLSINEFIRHTRLQEAHRLLLQGQLNVSEVAYSVGFTDPKYFSQCFKKQFGVSPSAMRTSA